MVCFSVPSYRWGRMSLYNIKKSENQIALAFLASRFIIKEKKDYFYVDMSISQLLRFYYDDKYG